MAAQASWTQHGPETGDDDRWRVMIAPGEVKVLTLEQLDDLFRLEIIDETTSVWGPQMTGWLPLGVAAGLEAEPKSPGAAPLVASGPPPGRSAPPPPPSKSAPPAPRLVATMPPSPAQVAAAFAAPSPASRPPAAFAPPMSPGAVISPAQAALFAPVPSVQVASETLRPMASESDLVFRASRSSSSGGWLIALAVLLGAGVTLYRNGVVRDVARSSGQEAIYGRLEAAVGGPSFGTLRAVEQLDATAPRGGSSAARVSVSSRKSSDVAAQPQEPAVVAKAEARSAAAGTVTHAVRLEDLAPAKAEGSGASNGTGPKPVSLDALPQPAAAREKPVAQTVSAVKRTPAAAAPSHASAAKPRAKDASRMHDPLNPDG